MFQPFSLMMRRVLRCARHRMQRWASLAIHRLLRGVSVPVQVGVLLQQEGWHRVLHDPGASRLHTHHPSLEQAALAAAQYQAWATDAQSERLSLQPGLVSGAWPPDLLTGWRRALQDVHNSLPNRPCHLTLAWPDDLLWTGAITLSGPLSQAEVPSLLEQELALALPVPIDQVAWDARPLAQPGDRPSDRGAWQTLWSWLRGRLGPAMGHQLASSGHSHQDAVWQCWAIPRALAHHIGAVGRQLGWVSVGIEPRSVSVQRATALWPPQADPLNAEVSIQGAPSPEALAAWGAAYRPPQQAPDLLRGHRGGWLLRGSLKARGWWPGLLAWGLAAGAGYALGGVVHERWAREHEAWAQRLRQLQAIEQARQANRQARDQARWQHQAHQAQVTYNQRFAQVLQGWASTVPEGVRWQQFSLRPRVIELQGQALDAESFTRWMDQWPQALPAGGQHQVHWQPEAPSVQPAQVPSVLGVRVQVSWNAAQKVTE